MKRCPACDRTFGDSMRFCQTDGSLLVAGDGDATLISGQHEDLLDVPSSAAAPPQDREDPIIDIPSLEGEAPRASSSSSAPPPSPYSSTPEPSSTYQATRDEEIRSTFGETSSEQWTPPSAPVAEWQSQPIGSNTPLQSPPVGVGNKNQTLSIISLVLGIAGLTVCCGAVLPSLAAIVTGVIARGKANANPNQFGGEGMALAGIITGIVGLVGGILVLIFWILGAFAGMAGGGAYAI